MENDKTLEEKVIDTLYIQALKDQKIQETLKKEDNKKQKIEVKEP